MAIRFKSRRNLIVYTLSIVFLMVSLLVNSAPALATQVDQVSSREPIPIEISPCTPESAVSSDGQLEITISDDDLEQGTSDILFELKMDMDRLLPEKEGFTPSPEEFSTQSSPPNCCTSCPVGCTCRCFSGYCFKFCI